MEEVILVDENDHAIGTMEKMEAHRKGLLHRAFSILVFNNQGELLLQKRSKSKYHSGGLWTNTCCSHPMPNENMEVAVRRKLHQEMGIDVDPEFSFKFKYRAELDNQLIEHEYDHVFFGTFNGSPSVNPKEVEDWKFITMNQLRTDVSAAPDDYTSWFRMILDRIEN